MPDAGLPIPGMVHRPLKHDSAEKHVAGTAAYIDDLPEPSNLLHIFMAQSPRAHARLIA